MPLTMSFAAINGYICDLNVMHECKSRSALSKQTQEEGGFFVLSAAFVLKS